jgi:hypothetical protein
MFIGSTLQIDLAGNSSTVTEGRIAFLAVLRTWGRTSMAAAIRRLPGSRPARRHRTGKRS